MVRHKKSLGQHFLHDNNILKKIADSAELSRDDLVLEVGTGIGTLTKHLAEKAGQVVTVELDKSLIPQAEANLKCYKNVELVNYDIMKMNIPAAMSKYAGFKHRKVVANIPYYITTPLIILLLESKADFEQITLLIQKEVAERIVSKPGVKAYGSFTLFVNYYAEPKIMFHVPATCFSPRPEVDSVVLRLRKLPKPPVEVKDEKLFFRLVRGAFVQRRKMLRNAILHANIEGISAAKLDEAFKNVGIDGKRRGETLSIGEFAKLSDRLSSSSSRRST